MPTGPRARVPGQRSTWTWWSGPDGNLAGQAGGPRPDLPSSTSGDGDVGPGLPVDPRDGARVPVHLAGVLEGGVVVGPELGEDGVTVAAAQLPAPVGLRRKHR